MFSHPFSQVISRLDPPLQEKPAPVLLCHDVPSVGLDDQSFFMIRRTPVTPLKTSFTNTSQIGCSANSEPGGRLPVVICGTT